MINRIPFRTLSESSRYFKLSIKAKLLLMFDEVPAFDFDRICKRLIDDSWLTFTNFWTDGDHLNAVQRWPPKQFRVAARRIQQNLMFDETGVKLYVIWTTATIIYSHYYLKNLNYTNKFSFKIWIFLFLPECFRFFKPWL